MDRCTQHTRSEKIAELNDKLRQTFIGGTIVFTPVIHKYLIRTSNGQKIFHEIYKAMAAFNSFNKDNDPHDEHDFGIIKIELTINSKNWWDKIKFALFPSMKVKEVRLCFKIEYVCYHNPKYKIKDPTNPKAGRTITIMLEEEYLRMKPEQKAFELAYWC